jgi:hypothetical protein
MPYFNSASDCISQVRQTASQFPNINLLLNAQEYNKWLQKLSSENDLEKYLLGDDVKFNLLNTLAVAAWELSNARQNQIGIPKLKKLNKWLTDFPGLLKDKSFDQKIKNLEGFNFLASMSELSFAAFLQSQGFSVTFEHKFIQVNSLRKKDVDISFSRQKGDAGYAEIYMPHHSENIAGFFGPDDSDHYIKYKVAMKLSDKFGSDGTLGLNGKVLLVVNYAAIDAMLIREAFPVFSNERMYVEMNKSLPKGVDGLAFFRDDFSSEGSFHFDRLIFS